MVLRGVGREDGRHSRVEAAPQDRRQTRGLEAVLIGPLPGVFEVRLVTGFVVRRVEVVAAAFEAGVHDREILVRKGHVDNDIGLELPEQRTQFGDVVGIDLGGFDTAAADGGRDGVAFRFGAAGQHDVAEYGVCGDLLRHHGSDTSGADNQGFTHRRHMFLHGSTKR